MTPLDPDASRPRHHFFGVIGEPNRWTFRALQTILAPEGFEVIQARTAAELIEQARGIRPDLIMVSDGFSDLEPPEICRLLRGMRSFNPATPILVTTSEVIDETHHIANLRAGAWDTIRLPASAEQLLLKIRRYVDAKAMSDAARNDGMIDSATGFYNLKGLLRRTEEEAAEAWRARRSIACVAFGPAISPEPDAAPGPQDERGPLHQRPELERALREVFRQAGRKSDVIGRTGPSEFVVVAPATDEGGAVHMGRRYLAEMQHLAVARAGREIPISMRAGYFSPGDPAPASVGPEELVAKAAGALRRNQTDIGSPPEVITPWRAGDAIILPVDESGAASRTPNGTE